MKNFLVPTINNNHTLNNKFLRSVVYSPGAKLKACKDLVSDNRNVYFIVAGSSGMLDITHLNICAKLLAKGLRHTQSGKRKNIIRKCKLNPKILNLTLTKKANGIRMGKGKGPIDRWILRVREGQILYSLERGVNPKAIEKPLLELNYKLPIKVSIVSRVN
jgi:hypothetical protein